MKKVLITPRSFGKYNREELIEKLLQHGIEPVFNPYGTIMNEQQMRSALQDMDGLIVGVDPVSEEALRQAPRLRAIAKYGVGIDNIACAYAQENDIAISRTVNANANAVADYAMTLLMSVARRVVEIDEGCHHNDWSKKEALDIYGKTIGVLGLGAIGKGVVQRASGFDMRIYGYDIMRDDAFLNKYNVCFTDVDTETVCDLRRRGSLRWWEAGGLHRRQGSRVRQRGSPNVHEKILLISNNGKSAATGRCR